MRLDAKLNDAAIFSLSKTEFFIIGVLLSGKVKKKIKRNKINRGEKMKRGIENFVIRTLQHRPINERMKK